MNNEKLIKWIMQRYEVTILDFGNYIIISFYKIQKQIKIELSTKSLEESKKEFNEKVTDLIINSK